MQAATDDLSARLDRLEAVNTDVTARLATVEAENRALRQQVAQGLPVPPVATAPVPTEIPPGDAPAALGRRQALRKGLAVAGAAAAGAVLLDATPAAAANGQPLILGASNSAASTTVLNGTFYATVGAGEGLYGVSTSGGGAYLYGGHHHLWFGPSSDRNAPTNENVAHQRGEVVLDKFGFLWTCVETGTPGTWRTLSGNGAAGVFYPFPAPQRTYDSRPGTAPSQGPKTPLAANTTRTISLANIGATGTIPSTAVMVNILLVNATAGNGNFTVWSADQPVPQANTLVWGGSAGRFSTQAFTTFDEAGRINVRASLATDIVIDVVGFYK